MNLERRIQHLIDDSRATLERCLPPLAGPLAEAAQRIVQSLLAGGKLLICGDGVAAADARQLAAQLLGRFERQRPGLPAIALETDCAALTEKQERFARQIAALGHPGDLLLVITTSGEAASLVRAVEAAEEQQMRVILLGGGHGGKLAELHDGDDLALGVDATNGARIQEVQRVCLHILCDLVDSLLLGDE